MLKSFIKFSTMRAAALGLALAGLSQPAFVCQQDCGGVLQGTELN